jgi:hypothetical protein
MPIRDGTLWHRRDLPMSGEIEQLLLGALLIDNQKYDQVAKHVKPEFFGNADHARLFEVMGDIIKAGRPANPITLQGAFDRKYLAQLAGAAALDDVMPLAREIADLAHRRQLIVAGEELAKAGRDITRPASDTIKEIATYLEETRSETTEDNGLDEWDFGEDNEPIPPRGWLLSNLLCRQFLTAIFADGAVGKTALIIAWALSLATGRNLIGEHVFMRCRVLLVCFEDGKDELRRRLTAAMLHHGVSKDDIRGHLIISAISRSDMKLARTKDGEVVAGRLGDHLEQVIIKRGIDVAFLDPLVKTHGVSENDNSAMDFVAERLSDIAIRRDCALCSPHHTRKGLTDPGNADAGRGAGSLKDAFRLCYTATPMSKPEAEIYGLSEDDRACLFRLDNGKVNLVRRPSNPRWFKLIGIEIGNSTALYPHGDEIQTVEPWGAPDVFAGTSTERLNKVLDHIDRGLDDGTRYSAAPAATNRAAWRVITEHLPEKNEKQSRSMIGTWVTNKVLISREYADPVRRDTAVGLFVNPAKRPGNETRV